MIRIILTVETSKQDIPLADLESGTVCANIHFNTKKNNLCKPKSYDFPENIQVRKILNVS